MSNTQKDETSVGDCVSLNLTDYALDAPKQSRTDEHTRQQRYNNKIMI